MLGAVVEEFEFKLSILFKIDVALVASFGLGFGVGFEVQLLDRSL